MNEFLGYVNMLSDKDPNTFMLIDKSINMNQSPDWKIERMLFCLPLFKHINLLSIPKD